MYLVELSTTNTNIANERPQLWQRTIFLSAAIMTELSFAKSFLATLDGRPIKLSPDHAADPKTFEHKGPVSRTHYSPVQPLSFHPNT